MKDRLYNSWFGRWFKFRFKLDSARKHTRWCIAYSQADRTADLNGFVGEVVAFQWDAHLIDLAIEREDKCFFGSVPLPCFANKVKILARDQHGILATAQRHSPLGGEHKGGLDVATDWRGV